MWFSSNFIIFNSQIYFCSLFKNFFAKKTKTKQNQKKKKNKQTNKKKRKLPLSQKIVIFLEIWYQKWILWLISIPNMYTFIYITVKV